MSSPKSRPSQAPSHPEVHVSDVLLSGVSFILRACIDGKVFAGKAISEQFRSHPEWNALTRSSFVHLVYGTLRWKRVLDFIASTPEDRRDLPTWRKRVLTYAKLSASTDFHTPTIPDLDRMPPAIAHSIPDWLEETGSATFGAQWDHLMDHLNHPPAMDLRVNTLKTCPEDAIGRLGEDGIHATQIPDLPDALEIAEHADLWNSGAFQEGWVEMQDRNSQRVVPLLDAHPGMCVIDACAGNGSKSLQISAHMQNKGRVIALDIASHKLDRLKLRARRAGVFNLEIRHIGDNKVIKRLAGRADCLLLDVPCSGLGTLRRNPELRWKVSPSDVQRLQLEQREILSRYAAMVKKGGCLVYATCSLLTQENQDQIQDWAQQHPDLWAVETTMQLPSPLQGDFLYACRLRRL